MYASRRPVGGEIMRMRRRESRRDEKRRGEEEMKG
jgi:hypothetical protein